MFGNQTSQIWSSGFASVEATPDVILGDLMKAYQKVHDEENVLLLIDFDDFLYRYLNSGGVRMRLLYGYQPGPEELDDFVSLDAVKRYVKTLRESCICNTDFCACSCRK